MNGRNRDGAVPPSNQSSLSMSSITRSMPSSMASMRSCMVQTNENKNPNLLRIEDSASAGEPPTLHLEMKCQRLEKESKQPMNEITKLQQMNQKNTQNNIWRKLETCSPRLTCCRIELKWRMLQAHQPAHLRYAVLYSAWRVLSSS